MNIMIIGADYLEGIEKKLIQSYGFSHIIHVSGRNVAHYKVSIPQTISLVVVFTNYINHCTVKHVKKQIKSQGIPTIFIKRSWPLLQKQLSRLV